MNVTPEIGSHGVTIPTYEQVWAEVVNTYKTIYGEDIYIEPDSQDGQWIGILALAFHDCNQAALTIFNSFSPSYAIGAHLSSLVKINGLKRHTADYSTTVGTVIGVAGTEIINGVVEDDSGNYWNLPSLVTIPVGGSIDVTVTSAKLGAIDVNIGGITKIATPTFGWQTFTNTATASLGAPVETDPLLRIRQTQSVSLSALTIKESIYAAIGNLPGVTRWTVHENDTGVEDIDGVPDHSIAVVAEGGDVTSILTAINERKAPGIRTFGSVSQSIEDTNGFGLRTTVHYQPLTRVNIYYAVTIKPLDGYVSTIGDEIVGAIIAYTNALKIGFDVHQFQVAAAASLNNSGYGLLYYISEFYLGVDPNPTTTTPVVMGYDQAAYTTAENISLVVL